VSATGVAPESPPACSNCGTPLQGKYCSACGQQRLDERDRRFTRWLADALRQVTEVDGKLLRSLRLLLFSPGLLSREYLDGRRARYSAPISLFLLANVLYFFSPAVSDFNLPFVDLVPGRIAAQALDPAAPDYAGRAAQVSRWNGQLHSRWTAPLALHKLQARAASEPGYDLRALARDYDAEAGIVGKALIIVHVPIIALALALVYLPRRRYFVEHFVVALHLFTFLLIFGQVVVASLNWLASHVQFDLPVIAMRAIGYALVATIFGYFGLACRTAYRTGWGAALLGLGAVLFALLFANIVVYRALQFLATLAMV
jgi:hypothetical protein